MTSHEILKVLKERCNGQAFLIKWAAWITGQPKSKLNAVCLQAKRDGLLTVELIQGVANSAKVNLFRWVV